MNTYPDINSRRNDLDWLRIIAFGLLIFYHIGMFYVSWGWHVKSVHAGPAAEPFMRLLNPWRLSLLFIISGIALRFAADKAASRKRGLLKFGWVRTWRLLIPIMFGIHVIVAPQAWLQLIESGQATKGFWAFYPEYMIGSLSKYSIVLPTWNHLWYVVYLMLYTLLLLPIAKPVSRLMNGRGAEFTAALFSGKAGIIWLVLVPILPHLLFRAFLDVRFPTTHDVINDWANHAHSLTFLITGFLLAKDAAFWSAVARAFKTAAILSLVLAVFLSITWLNWDAATELPALLFSARVLRVVYIWIVIVALLGAAQKWLNKPSKALTYMTEAIFPWYILHQTLTIIAGYWLTRQELSVGLEFLLVTLATFGGCLLIHEFFIRRFKYIRPLFGLKLRG